MAPVFCRYGRARLVLPHFLLSNSSCAFRSLKKTTFLDGFSANLPLMLSETKK